MWLESYKCVAFVTTLAFFIAAAERDVTLLKPVRSHDFDVYIDEYLSALPLRKHMHVVVINDGKDVTTFEHIKNSCDSCDVRVVSGRQMGHEKGKIQIYRPAKVHKNKISS